MRRTTILLSLAVVVAYVAGLATVPVYLAMSARVGSAAGTEISWTPEGGWTERHVTTNPGLEPPSGAQVAGVARSDTSGETSEP